MSAANDLLIRTLGANAVFSAVSAVVLLLAGSWVAAQLGLPGVAPIYAVAGLLVAFALQLGNIVRTRAVRRWEIAAIIAADLAWVAGSAVFVVLFYPALTTAGLLLVDAVALVVLVFAVQQYRGLRRMDSAPG